MSFAGGLWSSINRFASQAKLNLKSNIVGTGNEILSLSAGSLRKGMIASVTADSSGGSLKEGNIVQWDGNSWHTPEGTAHTHSSTADGGTFSNIMVNAIQNTWFVNMPCATKGQFHTSGTGATYTDTISGTNAYVLVSTGATTNNAGNLRLGGFTKSFAYPSYFCARVQIANSTSATTARCGINMEVADDVTNNKAKYGFEGCSGCNESYVSIISCDGVGLRSKNTESTDNYSGLGNYAMRLDPGVNVKYRKDGGAIITKGTVPPYTGVSDRANTFVTGIQTTTTASKTLILYGFNAAGYYGDTMPTI